MLRSNRVTGIALGLALASGIFCARAGAPGETAAEALRKSLLAAALRATSVHRAYEWVLDGSHVGRVELFRRDAARWIWLESTRRGAEPQTMELACDGTQIVALYGGPRPGRARLAGGPRFGDRAAMVDAGVAALCRVGAVTPPDVGEWGFDFQIQLPRPATSGGASDRGRIGARVGLEWLTPPGPTWLTRGSIEPGPEVAEIGTDLISVRIAGFDATLHRSDGCFARAAGLEPSTGERWELREIAPLHAPDELPRRVAAVCSEAPGSILDPEADSVGFASLMIGVLRLCRRADSPFLGPVGREAMLDVLLPCAFADAATTAQWRALVQETRRSSGANPSTTPAPAGDGVSVRAALSDRIADRLLTDVELELLSAFASLGDDVRAHTRTWIARRIEVLWAEAERSTTPPK